MNRLSDETKVRLAAILFGLIYIAVAMTKLDAGQDFDGIVCVALGVTVIWFATRIKGGV